MHTTPQILHAISSTYIIHQDPPSATAASFLLHHLIPQVPLLKDLDAKNGNQMGSILHVSPTSNCQIFISVKVQCPLTHLSNSTQLLSLLLFPTSSHSITDSWSSLFQAAWTLQTALSLPSSALPAQVLQPSLSPLTHHPFHAPLTPSAFLALAYCMFSIHFNHLTFLNTYTIFTHNRTNDIKACQS